MLETAGFKAFEELYAQVKCEVVPVVWYIRDGTLINIMIFLCKVLRLLHFCSTIRANAMLGGGAKPWQVESVIKTQVYKGIYQGILQF